MTPKYIADVFARRGYKDAMKAATASQDVSLTRLVMVISFEKTGVAKPVQVFKRQGRKNVLAGVTEGASPEELSIVQAILAERVSRRPATVDTIRHTSFRKPSSAPKIPRGFTEREWAHRRPDQTKSTQPKGGTTSPALFFSR